MAKDKEIVNKIRKIFEDEIQSENDENLEYPKEALPLGTFVRSAGHERLGIISDAFYKGVDLDNKKIIVYTILFLPDSFAAPSSPDYIQKSQLYIANEYEYDVTAFLMISPVDMSDMSINISGDFY